VSELVNQSMESLGNGGSNRGGTIRGLTSFRDSKHDPGTFRFFVLPRLAQPMVATAAVCSSRRIRHPIFSPLVLSKPPPSSAGSTTVRRLCRLAYQRFYPVMHCAIRLACPEHVRRQYRHESSRCPKQERKSSSFFYFFFKNMSTVHV